MSFYNHSKIEPKWQGHWAESPFKTEQMPQARVCCARYSLPVWSRSAWDTRGYSDWYLSRYDVPKVTNISYPMGGMLLVCLRTAAMDTEWPSGFTAENVANFKRQINGGLLRLDRDQHNRSNHKMDPVVSPTLKKDWPMKPTVNWVEELREQPLPTRILHGTSQAGSYQLSW